MIPHVQLMNCTVTFEKSVEYPPSSLNRFSHIFRGNDSILTNILRPKHPVVYLHFSFLLYKALLLIGLPCSGKSYFSQLFRLKYLNERFHVISGDNIYMTCYV